MLRLPWTRREAAPRLGVGVVGTRMPGELRQVLDECFLSALATWSFILNYKISSNSKT